MRRAFKVFEPAQEAIFIPDAECRRVTVNKAFCAITGYSAAEALELSLEVLPTQAGSIHPPSFFLWDELEKHGAWQGELRGLRKDGEGYRVWLSVSRLNWEEDRADPTVGVFSDISELRQAEGRLHHLAHHDTLTGLPNRLLEVVAGVLRQGLDGRIGVGCR